MRPTPRTAALPLLAASLAGACVSLPDIDTVDRTETTALQDASGTRLQVDLQPLLDAHPDQSGFHTLPVGEDAFIERLRLVHLADRTLDLQYYIWHEDLTGDALFHGLLAAADRGVRVRLLLDDLNTKGMDPTLRVLDAHEHIEVRVFNPFANRKNRLDDILTDPKRINHRMHNKSITADALATIFGGRNVGDEYFAANEEVVFGDMDALAVGPIAGEVAAQFDLYWNSPYVFPVATFYDDQPGSDEIADYRTRSEERSREARGSRYAEALKAFDTNPEHTLSGFDFAWSEWVLAHDQPAKIETKEISPSTHLFPALLEGMDLAKDDLLIVSPYFIPGDELTDYLISRVDDGVRVRILTNSLMSNDVGAVHAGYMRYRKRLVEGGVELYELRADLGDRAAAGREVVESEKSSLHAKFFVFDEAWLWVGSYNMDGRSTIFNTELGAYFRSPVEAEQMVAWFDENIEEIAFRVELDDGDLRWRTVRGGQQEVLTREPDAGWWKRMVAGVLRVIVPEKQL